MGTSFTNCHVRTTDPQAVQDALTELAIPAFVSDAANGWVSVFPVDNLDPVQVAARLAERLNLPVLYLWEYDSDVGGYSLYEGAALRDEYETDPDHWADDLGQDGEPIPHKSPEEVSRLAGKPDALLPFCIHGTTIEDIRTALGKSHADSINNLAAHLGRDPAEMQEDFCKNMEEGMARFAPLLIRLGQGDQLRDFSYDDHLAEPDPNSVLPALAELLGINPDRYSENFSRLASGDGDFNSILVGGVLMSQEHKNYQLRHAMSQPTFYPEGAARAIEAVKRWLALGADPTVEDGPSALHGFTMLHAAIHSANATIIRLILEAGPDPNRRDIYGRTPLDLAVTIPESHPQRAEIIELLRVAGAAE